MFTTKSLLAILAGASISLAAPTTTTREEAHIVHKAPKTTHSVTVGFGLTFSPDNVNALPGSVVEFHFLAKNHTVTQSSFAQPCQPLDGGFNSDFVPVAQPGTQSPNVFQIEVKDKNPLWFYCAQTTGNHCQSGMSGVINQNPDAPNNLRAYKEKAKTQVTIAGKATSAGAVGGQLIKNPNPNGGF